MEQTQTQAPTHVVTNFLLRRDIGRDEILLVRRSQRVRTYRGAWAGISGYVEPGVSPLEQAYTELREEVGLKHDDLTLLRAGEPIAVDDAQRSLSWVVHPFLFSLNDPARIRTDWEATEHRWIPPADIASYETVPKLAEALAAVYSTQESTHGPA